MNPLEWKWPAQVILAGSVVGAAVAIVTGGPVLADAVPFATKAYVVAQLASQTQINNVTRMDLLEFQITTLKNQASQLKMVLRAAPGDIGLTDDLADTQATVEKKQRELNLLKCLVEQRNPCVQ